MITFAKRDNEYQIILIPITIRLIKVLKTYEFVIL